MHKKYIAKIISVILAAMMLLSFASCDLLKSPEPMTEKEFIAKVGEYKYSTNIEGVASYEEDLVVSKLLATRPLSPSVEFYITASNEKSKALCERLIALFENEETLSSHSKTELSDSIVYRGTSSDGQYLIIIATGNTLLSSSDEVRYEDDAIDLFARLGCAV
ncbi:MAG: hypothetical protein UH542_00870 [Bacteroidales bacterium]|nr:hypothetical protein [Bacteroidales bacterium]